jgi:hypothetical protein
MSSPHEPPRSPQRGPCKRRLKVAGAFVRSPSRSISPTGWSGLRVRYQTNQATTRVAYQSQPSTCALKVTRALRHAGIAGTLERNVVVRAEHAQAKPPSPVRVRAQVAEKAQNGGSSIRKFDKCLGIGASSVSRRDDAEAEQCLLSDACQNPFLARNRERVREPG